VLVTGIMMVGQSFAFVLSVGASRRIFAQGTGLTAVVLAISFGSLMTALGYIEQATNGWGMDGHFFALSWLADGNVLVRWAILTAPFLATFLLGSWVAAIFVRWNAAGLFCAALLTLLTAGAAAVLISWQHSWPSLGGWLADQTNLSTSGWVALLCLPLAASGYATLRRASV
ncbi:MAG: hypothetical protein ACRDQA_31595, partial [Nocardioidaceae bacterium]